MRFLHPITQLNKAPEKNRRTPYKRNPDDLFEKCPFTCLIALNGFRMSGEGVFGGIYWKFGSGQSLVHDTRNYEELRKSDCASYHLFGNCKGLLSHNSLYCSLAMSRGCTGKDWSGQRRPSRAVRYLEEGQIHRANLRMPIEPFKGAH